MAVFLGRLVASFESTGTTATAQDADVKEDRVEMQRGREWWKHMRNEQTISPQKSRVTVDSEIICLSILDHAATPLDIPHFTNVRNENTCSAIASEQTAHLVSVAMAVLAFR